MQKKYISTQKPILKSQKSELKESGFSFGSEKIELKEDRQETQKLLESLINEIISEDNDYSELGGNIYSDYRDSMGSMDVGYHNLSDLNLLRGLINPFTRVFKVAKGALSTVAASVQNLVAQTLAGAIGLLIPFYETDYKAMDQKYRNQLIQVKNSYKDALAESWKVLQNNDLWTMAFLWNPTLILGTGVARTAPLAVWEFIKTISGHNPYLLNFAQNIKTKLNPNKLWTEQETAREILDHGRGDKMFLAAALGGTLAKDMNRNVINIFIRQIKDFLSIKTFDELYDKTGGVLTKPKQKIEALRQNKDIDDKQKIEMEKALLEEAKKQYKEFYIKKLRQQGAYNNSILPEINQAISEIQQMR